MMKKDGRFLRATDKKVKVAQDGGSAVSRIGCPDW